MQASNEVSWLPQEIQHELLLTDSTKMQEYDEGKELLESAMTRSTTDLDFRRELLEKPQATVTAFYQEKHGRPFPGQGTAPDVRFVENEGDVTFVLPPAIDAEAELSEAELAAVAGGGTPAALVQPLVTLVGAITSNAVCAGIAVGVATTAAIIYIVETNR